MSLDVNISEPDEFNCKELHSYISVVAKIKSFDNYAYHVDFICGKGENYVANIFRVVLTDSENDNNKAKVIVKTLINTERMELFHELHEREVFAYDQIMPKYVKFLKLFKVEDRIAFPEFVYSAIEKSKEVLVLEDINEKGYFTDKTLTKLDYTLVRDVLVELAKFHSLSIIYEKHEPENFVKLKTELRDIIFCESFLNKTKLMNYFDESFGTSLDLVGNTEAKSKLVSIKAKLLDLLRWFTRPVDGGVLCHGDFWINNVMFKREETSPTQACFIDFQTMRYASPLTDFFQFFYLHTDSTFRREHSTSLYNAYYDTLTRSLSLYDIDVNLVYNTDRFSKDLEEFKPYGFLIAMVELKLVTLISDENELCNDEDRVLNDCGGKLDEKEYHKMMINDLVVESLENAVIDKLLDKINDL